MYATSVTDEQFDQANVNVSVSASVGLPFANIETTVEAGYTTGWNKSTGETWENSYTQAVETTTGTSQSIEVAFDSTYAEGFYRYVLFGLIDVYALVIYDPDKQNDGFTVKMISDVVSSFYALDYSPDARFNDQKPEELPFDVSLLDGLGYEPGTDYSTPPPQLPDPGETKYTHTFSVASGQRDKRITEDDGREYCDEITTFFELDKLTATGYKSFSITVKYDAKEINDQWMQLWIRKDHGRNGKQWFYKYWDHGGSG